MDCSLLRGWARCAQGQALPGRQHDALDERQVRWIYKAVTEKDPRQFQFEFALWTVAMIWAVATAAIRTCA